MNERERLLLISPLPPPPGGISYWTAIVRDEVERAGIIDSAVVDTAVRWRNFDNTRLPLRLFGGSCQAIRDALRVRRSLRCWQPTCVHINTSASLACAKDTLFLLAARRFGIRRVLHFHVGYLPALRERNGFHWAAVRRNMNLADLTLVLGQETARSLRQGNDDLRIEGVTVPVPTAGLRAQMGAFEAGGPMGSRPARLMFLGQAHAGKGVRELVMACRQLDGQGFTLTVVGPITGKMRSVLLELAGPESERWLAVKGELPRAEALAELGSSDILILPSTWTTEAFPAVVLEAMACGRCVVASDRGAVREMLAVGTPDECGVLVEPGNVGHLARVLQSLLAAPARVAELGQNGRRRVMQNYDAPVVVGHLMRHWFPALTPAAAVSRGASATPAEAPTDECTPKAMPAHFTAGVVSR